MELRELRGDDMFSMLSIIGKLDIKDDLLELFEKQQDKDSQMLGHLSKKPTKAEKEKQDKMLEKRGMQMIAGLIQTILANINKAKSDINTFLADLTNTSIQEIQELNFVDYTQLIVKFFKKPELKDFLTSISSILSSGNTL
jgi:hypothetical protein